MLRVHLASVGTDHTNPLILCADQLSGRTLYGKPKRASTVEQQALVSETHAALQDGIVDKLKLLNYEQDFCKPK